MQKKLTLVFVLSQLFTLTVFSQLNTNEAVFKKMVQEIKDAQQKNYALTLQLAARKGWPLSFTTPKGGIIKLIGVDNFGNPLYYSTFNNIIAAATTRTNQLWPGGSSGLNLSGSSDAVKGKLGIWDGGSPLTTHVELTGRILVKDGAILADHPTFTSGTLIASGVNPIAKGMAFGAQQLISYDFDNDVQEMITEAPNLLLSNHSYGLLAGWNYDGTNWSWYGDTTISRESYYFGYYNSRAQLYDSISYNAPYYLICFAAGNTRNEIGPDAGASYKYNGGTTVTRTNISNNPDYGSVALNSAAKNILLIGAVNGLPDGYQKSSDVSLADFSSSGPTDDGRIKPDVVADGINVTSSSSNSNNAYESGDGTSASCPNVTGSLYLLQEYYTRLHPGIFMRSSTLKALAIHTADEAGNTGPDYHYGWGLLNVLKAASVITSSFNHQSDTIIENSLDNAANAAYSINLVASGKGTLSATIVWNDPPALVNNNRTTVLNDPTSKLIHDLDLRITRQSDGTVYMPWVLVPSNPSAPAIKGDNILDNVEQVVVDGLIPGQTYTIQVSHKGSLARGSQAFSLIVSGIGGQAYCASAPTSNAGARIDEVDFGSINKVNGSGCTTYNNYTNLSTNIEAGQTLPITVKMSSCDASTNPKIVKVFIDFNNNGSFTDAGELVATSTAISGAGNFTTNVTIPGNIIIGNSSIMRVIVQETSDPANVNPCGNYGNGETQDYKVVFIGSSNDLGLLDIVSPQAGDCPDQSQYITVRIKNNGTTNKQNIPLTVNIKNGSTTIASINETFKGSVNVDTVADYTFQTPFVSAGGITYTYEAIVSNSTDPYKANDTLRKQITIPIQAAAPDATGEICGSTAILKVNNPSATDYFWYTDTTNYVPVTTDANATTTTIPSNNKYFVTSGGRQTLGPLNKLVFTDGGYNTFVGNYIQLTSTLPSILETTRLYIGNSGRIKFVLNPMASATSYYPSLGDSVTLDVYATSPTPPTLGAQINDPSDTGATYRLNLIMDNSVSANYIMFIYCTNGASIYRNNNITSINPYPVGFPPLVTITSNSAPTFQNYYYFFYNTKVKTLNECISSVATVTAVVAPAPVVSQSGSNLVSSISTGNQWYLNSALISGAVGSTYTPTQSGTYSVVVTDAFNCQKSSNNFDLVITALPVVSPSEINLKLLPNPSTGNFTIKMHLNIPANLQFDFINAQGQIVQTETFKNVSGDFSKSAHAEKLSSGVYMLRITDGKKVYYIKLIIAK